MWTVSGTIGATALLGGILAACASSRGGVEANQARFERSVGVGTRVEVYDKAMKVVRQHQFEVERESTESGIYIETRWRNRSPFSDELSMGIATAQVRMIVRGNLRSTTELGELFSVNMVVETRVQTRDSPDWTGAIATAEYRAWAQRVTDDLRRELDVGVRRFGTGH